MRVVMAPANTTQGVPLGRGKKKVSRSARSKISGTKKVSKKIGKFE
jgi:hypothetical protein